MADGIDIPISVPGAQSARTIMDQMLVVLRSIDDASKRTAVAAEALSRRFVGLAESEKKATDAGAGLARQMPRVRDEMDKTSKSALTARQSLGQFGDGLMARFLGITGVFTAARSGIQSFSTLFNAQMGEYEKALSARGKQQLRTGEVRRDLGLLGLTAEQTGSLAAEIDRTQGGGTPGQARDFALSVAESEARRRGSTGESIAGAVRAALADFQANQFGEIGGSGDIYQKLRDADPAGERFANRGEIAAALALQQRRMADDEFQQLMSGIVAGTVEVGSFGRLSGSGVSEDLLDSINERGGLMMRDRTHVWGRFSQGGEEREWTQSETVRGLNPAIVNPELSNARASQWSQWISENVQNGQLPDKPQKSGLQKFFDDPQLFFHDMAKEMGKAVAEAIKNIFTEQVPAAVDVIAGPIVDPVGTFEKTKRRGFLQGIENQLDIFGRRSGTDMPGKELQAKMDAFFSGSVVLPVRAVPPVTAQETP